MSADAAERDDLEVRRYLHHDAVGRILLLGPESMRSARKGQFVGALVALVLLVAAAGYSLISGRAGALPSYGVVEADGSYFLIRDSVAHPVLNAASALLLGQGIVQPVGAAVIAAAPLGRPVGIAAAPLVLPSKPPAVPGEWSLCATMPRAALSPLTMSFAAPRAPRSNATLLARDGSGSLWLLHDKFRFAITEQVAANLGLNEPIGPPQALLDGVAVGAAIAVAIADGVGGSPEVSLQFAAAIGDVVEVSTGPARYFRVVREGLIPLTAFAFAAYAPGAPHQLVIAAGSVDHVLASDVPEQWPTDRFFETVIRNRDAVCVGGANGLVVRPAAAGVDVAAVTSSSLTTVAVPRAGVAIRAGGALSIVSGAGTRYPVVSDDVLQWLGYSAENVLDVPCAVADLLPIGATLDPSLAMSER